MMTLRTAKMTIDSESAPIETEIGQRTGEGWEATTMRATGQIGSAARGLDRSVRTAPTESARHASAHLMTPMMNRTAKLTIDSESAPIGTEIGQRTGEGWEETMRATGQIGSAARGLDRSVRTAPTESARHVSVHRMTPMMWLLSTTKMMRMRAMM